MPSKIPTRETQFNVGCALANVSVVKNSLHVFRNDVDSKHSVWLQKAQRIAKELDVTVENLGHV